MIPKVAIFIPTYKRPSEMIRVYESVSEATPEEHEVYFVLEADDSESLALATVNNYSFVINEGEFGYPESINTAYHKTDEHLFFMGADNLIFHPNWLENAFNWFGKGVEVVGVNSLHDIRVEIGETAKNCLVKRSYIKRFSGVVGNENTVLYNYPYYMEEFVETAKARGMFLSAKRSIVEVPITIDDTSPKEGFELFEERRKVWEQE